MRPLQHTDIPCNTLQHAATHSNTLQHTATERIHNETTATHRNILQHTATFQYHQLKTSHLHFSRTRMNSKCAIKISQTQCHELNMVLQQLNIVLQHLNLTSSKQFNAFSRTQMNSAFISHELHVTNAIYICIKHISAHISARTQMKSNFLKISRTQCHTINTVLQHLNITSSKRGISFSRTHMRHTDLTNFISPTTYTYICIYTHIFARISTSQYHQLRTSSFLLANSNAQNVSRSHELSVTNDVHI